MSYLGYFRPDGSIGIRNHVGILSTVTCANDVTRRVHWQVQGTAAFTHSKGCGQTPPDLDIATRTLISLGKNPNLAGVVLVSLGCEGLSVDRVVQGIAESGKPVDKVVIQEYGAVEAVSRGCHIARSMVGDATRAKREEAPNSELRVGVKCGASDAISGLAANPAMGEACDMFIDEGGSCVFGETTELMGAEHILARRAATPEIAKKIYEIVERQEKRVLATGVDMRGGQPSPGNMEGGLTTIEEKSLGAISKGGTRPINGVCEYGEAPIGKGLFIVDSPGLESNVLTALAAAGCHVTLFSTGLGVPHSFPFMPVIKITANPETSRRLDQHIDLLVEVNRGSQGIHQAAHSIHSMVEDVASGKMTKAEIMGYYTDTDIWMVGPII